MTFAERLRDEGRIEGRRDGHKEGQRERHAAVVARQLTLRFGELDARQLERLKSADDATLHEWTDRVLTAANIDEVLGDAPPPRAD